jgi:hypothetical protein
MLSRLAIVTLLFACVASPVAAGQAPPLVVPAKFDVEGFVQFLVPVRVRGHEFWCGLDSGGSWVFRLDTAKALAAGLTPNSSGTHAGAGPDVVRDQRVQGVTAELGGLVLPNLTIVLSQLPEIIPDKQMWLEPAAPLPDRQAFDASGVHFAHAPNGAIKEALRVSGATRTLIVMRGDAPHTITMVLKELL